MFGLSEQTTYLCTTVDVIPNIDSECKTTVSFSLSLHLISLSWHGE